jgi:hypothetical protein
MPSDSHLTAWTRKSCGLLPGAKPCACPPPRLRCGALRRRRPDQAARGGAARRQVLLVPDVHVRHTGLLHHVRADGGGRVAQPDDRGRRQRGLLLHVEPVRGVHPAAPGARPWPPRASCWASSFASPCPGAARKALDWALRRRVRSGAQRGGGAGLLCMHVCSTAGPRRSALAEIVPRAAASPAAT